MGRNKTLPQTVQPKPFGVGHAAKLLGISEKLVRDCCDSGDLKSVRMPGSLHRRIYRDDLEAFATKHGLRLLG